MAIHVLSLMFSCLVIFFFYYAVKLFVFWLLKKVLKLKFMKDKKFKIFGEEI